MMVAFTYLLLLAIVSLVIPLGFVVAWHTRTTSSIRLVNRVERVAVVAPVALQRGDAALRRLAERYGRSGRVIITDADGVLVGDSDDQDRLGRDYTYRPEIVAALNGRMTRLVRDFPEEGPQYIVAMPVVSNGEIVGAVRASTPVMGADI